MDLATWGGISLLVMGLIEAGKRAFDVLAEPQKAARMSLILGVALGLTAKIGGFMELPAGFGGYALAVLGGLMAGGGAQLVHNNILNPLFGKDPNPL